MDIVKIFAALLTIAGMALLIFASVAFLQGSGTLLGVDVSNRASCLVPFVLGLLFFAAGIYLFRYMLPGGRYRSRSRY